MAGGRLNRHSPCFPTIYTLNERHLIKGKKKTANEIHEDANQIPDCISFFLLGGGGDSTSKNRYFARPLLHNDSRIGDDLKNCARKQLNTRNYMKQEYKTKEARFIEIL